jgi:hypothetical protein
MTESAKKIIIDDDNENDDDDDDDDGCGSCDEIVQVFPYFLKVAVSQKNNY